jgi:hypothetical protein
VRDSNEINKTKKREERINVSFEIKEFLFDNDKLHNVLIEKEALIDGMIYLMNGDYNSGVNSVMTYIINEYTSKHYNRKQDLTILSLALSTLKSDGNGTKQAMDKFWEQIASPVGAYKKKQTGLMKTSITSFVGAQIFRSHYTQSDGDNVFSPMASLGVDVTNIGGFWNNNGIYIQIFDLGTLVYDRLSDNRNDNLEYTEDDIKFKNIYAPGIYYRHAFNNSPFVWGFGYSKTPSLNRAYDKDGAIQNTFKVSEERFGVFFAVDITLYPFF